MKPNIAPRQESLAAAEKTRQNRCLGRIKRKIMLAAATIGTSALFAGALLDTRVWADDADDAIVEAASQQALASDAMDVESFDGTNNNLTNPKWGSAGSDLLRLAPAANTGGGLSLPNDQSARAISNLVNSQADPADSTDDIQTIDQNSLADFGYAFGQFMDHDMDNTPDGGASVPIAVATDDPIGPGALPFTRSQTDPATGQQINIVTSYLDLSQVYGSSAVVAEALRTFEGGLLKTSPGNMLPFNSTAYFTAEQITALNMANDAGAVAQSDLFAAGDERANENVELTALETLFVRNHNRLAAQLHKEHSGWSDEQLYQEARKINIAQYQCIIYNEWIPAVLGPGALSKYRGYKPGVNAGIANEFSTVAYRFGHSMVSPSIAREGNNGQAVQDPIDLAVDFFDPNLLDPRGVIDPLTGLVSTDIGPILKGDADGNGQAMDVMVISDIRNLLFGNGISGGQDLIALDVQRGRDHEIPDYNTLRVAVGLPAVTSFAQITADVEVQHDLELAYPGGVDTIDGFEGGVAEDHVKGSDVGPLFQAIMVNQFERLRDGDRFFYLNEVFNADEANLLMQGNTLAKIIKANTDITNLQSNVMVFAASISGKVTVAGLPAGTPPQPITVELEDDAGDVLATTTTDERGEYGFDQLSGPAGNLTVAPGVSGTGTYVITLELPAGMQQDSAAPDPIEITSGDTHITGVDFSVSAAPPRPRQRVRAR